MIIQLLRDRGPVHGSLDDIEVIRHLLSADRVQEYVGAIEAIRTDIEAATIGQLLHHRGRTNQVKSSNRVG